MSYDIRVHLPASLKHCTITTANNVLNTSQFTQSSVGAVVCVSGAGGGVHGPAGIYAELCSELSQAGLIGVQQDYRHPAVLDPCVTDTLQTCNMLQQKYGVSQIVLIGWSFGGAVVITSGAAHKSIVGVATVASQTSGADRVHELGSAGKSLLLLHGTADTCLTPNCSRQLYTRATEPKQLVLYKNDNHGLTLHRAEMKAKLKEFCADLLVPQPTSDDKENVSAVNVPNRGAVSRQDSAKMKL